MRGEECLPPMRSEGMLDHSTERINPDGRRGITNPARRPDPGADELKTLIRTIVEGAAVTRQAEGG